MKTAVIIQSFALLLNLATSTFNKHEHHVEEPDLLVTMLDSLKKELVSIHEVKDRLQDDSEDTSMVDFNDSEDVAQRHRRAVSEDDLLALLCRGMMEKEF